MQFKSKNPIYFQIWPYSSFSINLTVDKLPIKIDLSSTRALHEYNSAKSDKRKKH